MQYLQDLQTRQATTSESPLSNSTTTSSHYYIIDHFWITSGTTSEDSKLKGAIGTSQSPATSDLNTKERESSYNKLETALTLLAAHRGLRDESTTTSRSTMSSEEVATQQPQLYIGMISLQDDIEDEATTLHDFRQSHL